MSLLTIMSCKTQKYTLADYEGQVLGFGNGGGFTGAFTYFKLLDNGQLFHSKDGNNYTEIAGIDKDTAAQMFENFSTFGFENMRINDPGNMTYFVTMGQGERVQKIAWGGGKLEPEPVLKQYYTTLISLGGRSQNPKK